MTNAGQRIATARGAMLADPSMLGNSLLSCGEALFEPQFWAARGEAIPASAGRGAAWFVRWREHRWVLRHSRRGGLLAPLTRDRYVWMSETRVRTFAEWRLLHTLAARGLPVPKPVLACYQRAGFVYRCSLITERIRHARPLSTELAARVLPPEVWSEAGAVIARLHRAGADHADLNAHNVLCGYGIANAGSISGDRLRPRTFAHTRKVATGNLARLRRSLEKISSSLPPGRFSPREWAWLESGYGAA